MNTLKTLRHGTFVLLAWLALGSAASAQLPAPAASAVVNGSYTVNYPPGCDAFLPPDYYCAFVYLLEMTSSSGQWAVVSQGTGSISFAGRAPGTYSYMLWVAAYDYWGGYNEAYSEVTTVVVASAAQPVAARDNILSQLNYRYEVRRGDFNWDNRTDLFVRKVAGGSPLNGTVENLILRQDGAINGKFVPVVPTPDQAMSAAAWAPAPSIQVRLHDIDVDGYVDLTLANVASVVGGAADQIVYSPGQPGSAVPGGLRHGVADLGRFVGNAMDYLADPDYFVKNAPLYFYQTWVWYTWCPLLGIGGVEAYYWQTFTYCYVDYIYYYGYYFDFSAFDQRAVTLWYAEDQGESGGISRETAMDTIKAIIGDILQSQIGGWPMEELFGQVGPHTDGTLRDAIEAIQAILNTARAIPEHVDMDNLPPQTPRARDVIHVTGHELFLNRKAHLALEYARPQLVDGLYDPTTLSGQAENWPPVACFPWMQLSLCGWGKLLAETNKTSDHWYSNFKVGEVMPLFGTPGSYWDTSLVPRHERYIAVPYASKPNYNALPDAGTNTYNSNGYVRGLNGQGGFFVVPPAMNSVYPGWDRPVPNGFFQ